MNKLSSVFLAFLFLWSLNVSAQVAQSAQKGAVKTEKKAAVKKESANKEQSKKTTVKKETKQESVSNTAPKKKDGTPDKRYKANKHLKKDGTPDKRYKGNK